MDFKKAQKIIEAVLFASGDPVSIEELNTILDVDNAEEITEDLAKKWEKDQKGLLIKRVADKFYICTNSEYYDYIIKLVEPRKAAGLSNAALETLSIVVYNQPVTRSTIEFIRGVNSDAALGRLVERGLVEECGRLETPGKPLIYRTTDLFLRTFGLNDISDMPNIQTIPLQTLFYDNENKDESVEEAPAESETGEETPDAE